MSYLHQILGIKKLQKVKKISKATDRKIIDRKVLYLNTTVMQILKMFTYKMTTLNGTNG